MGLFGADGEDRWRLVRRLAQGVDDGAQAFGVSSLTEGADAQDLAIHLYWRWPHAPVVDIDGERHDRDLGAGKERRRPGPLLLADDDNLRRRGHGRPVC